jgi:hypothetical protein
MNDNGFKSHLPHEYTRVNTCVFRYAGEFMAETCPFLSMSRPNASAAAASRDVYTSRYRSIVTAMVKCPRRLLTTSIGTPAAAINDACVSRNESKVTLCSPQRLSNSSTLCRRLRATTLPSACAKDEIAVLVCGPQGLAIGALLPIDINRFPHPAERRAVFPTNSPSKQSVSILRVPLGVLKAVLCGTP